MHKFTSEIFLKKRLDFELLEPVIIILASK